MISLSSSNKFITLALIFFLLCGLVKSEEPEDIWDENNQDLEKKEEDQKTEQTTQSLILIKDEKSVEDGINEETADETQNNVIGLFDPETNNLSLDMWTNSDGKEIKNTILRINKLKLSNFPKKLFFQVLFTNTYSPNNYTDEFLDFKIEWLIKEKKIKELENFIIQNPVISKKPEVIHLLVDEYLSSADINSACEKAKLIHKDVQDNYLDKLNVYCLIEENRQEEAILFMDLLKERGFKDTFFEEKINYLFGYTKKTNGKIRDDNLINFYLSQVTSENFEYTPSDKTPKYIWRYLSSANLLDDQDLEKLLEDEETIKAYEKAASEDSFDKNEIFNIYKQFLFNINQFLNVRDAYKNLPNYKARALVYQSILISDNIENKLELLFILKDLFDKDKIFNAYAEKLSDLLYEIEAEEIPEGYFDLVERYKIKDQIVNKKIKFNNKIIHQSKLLKYFIEEDADKEKTEKDLKNLYKKIKKNKKYFISIKDIILLEALKVDGIALPKDLDYSELVSKLTTPEGLVKLANENQTGLLLLKIIEIIGEDKVEELDPETIYFLSDLLSKLELMKIRNNILFYVLSI